MYQHVKDRLQALVDNRGYFFRETSKADAEKYLAQKTAFAGISRQEITTLEAQFGFTFPTDFVGYLLHFGQNCGELFCMGQDLIVSQFKDYQEFADSLRRFHAPTDQLFVFEVHQGYAGCYFCRNEKDEMAVWEFSESIERPIRKCNTFFELVEQQVLQLEKTNALVRETGGQIIILSAGSIMLTSGKHYDGFHAIEVGDIYLEDKEKDPFIIKMKKEWGDL